MEMRILRKIEMDSRCDSIGNEAIRGRLGVVLIVSRIEELS